MFEISVVKISLICLSLVVICVSHHTPHTPCPELFNYYENENREVFGGMTFDNDQTGVYDLVVNMTIPIQTKMNIDIQRQTPDAEVQRGASIEYYVIFPQQHTIPEVMSIMFNNRIYCSSATSLTGLVTILSKRDILYTNIPLSGSNNQQNIRPNRPQFVQPNKPQQIQPRPPIIQQQEPQTVITQPRPVFSEPIRPTTVINVRPQIQININNNIGNEECGQNIDYQPLIFFGSSTRSGEYPWLVAIFRLIKGSYVFICAGSLISTSHVITAGHCVRSYTDLKDFKKEDMLLVLGKHNIKSWAQKSTIRDIKEFIVHPEYRGPGDADIAVVVMDNPVQYSISIKPICLWDEPDSLQSIVGQKGVVAGWGKDETGREFVDEPRQITIPIVSQEACLRADERFRKLTSERTLCAGYSGGETQATPCTGDSGGGFIIQRAGKWKLRGVVSVALKDKQTQTCDSKNYVVFSDVPKYQPWLIKVLQTS